MRSDIKTAARKGMLVLAVVTSILAASAFGQGQKSKKPAAPAKGPFTGVWDTQAAGRRFTVKLTQTGNKVTGTYTPYNGKIFGGVVTGDKVEFKWSQDGGGEGIGEFTLNADRKGFTGSSTMLKPELQTNAWNTFVYVPAPPRSFAGTWDIVNNVGVRIPLTIVQQGAKVTGVYPAQNGKLEGTVDGRLLKFKWVSDKGSGIGQLNISNTGESLNVRFMNDKGQDVAGPAGLASWGEPASGQGSNGEPDTTDGGITGGKGGKITALYGGSWLINESGASGGMDLTQSGTSVSGTYATNRGPYALKDAKVNGSFLRFRLVPMMAGLIEKVGELKMDPDGTSFKGTVGGIPVTGTTRNP